VSRPERSPSFSLRLYQLAFFLSFGPQQAAVPNTPYIHSPVTFLFGQLGSQSWQARDRILTLGLGQGIAGRLADVYWCSSN
jgi:hypothetical protein